MVVMEGCPGVQFTLALSGVRIRPAGVVRIPPHMEVTTVLGFSDWEVEHSGEFVPFQLDIGSVVFLNSRGGRIYDSKWIGAFGMDVQVVISPTREESFEGVDPNVDLDTITTPRTPRDAYTP